MEYYFQKLISFENVYIFKFQKWLKFQVCKRNYYEQRYKKKLLVPQNQT